MSKNIFNININIAGKEVLFQTADNQIFCTSLDIANVFEKRHDHILGLIYEKLKNEEIKDFTNPNFRVSNYKDSTGRTLPCYKLTRDGFSFVAMGLTGRKADLWKVSFINAFNQMEQALKIFEEEKFLEHTQKEVFNLKYKTPCRDAILEEISKIEQEKNAKCINVREYKIEETFKNGKVQTTSQVQLDFDRPVRHTLNEPKVTKRQVEEESQAIQTKKLRR